MRESHTIFEKSQKNTLMLSGRSEIRVCVKTKPREKMCEYLFDPPLFCHRLTPEFNSLTYLRNQTFHRYGTFLSCMAPDDFTY